MKNFDRLALPGHGTTDCIHCHEELTSINPCCCDSGTYADGSHDEGYCHVCCPAHGRPAKSVANEPIINIQEYLKKYGYCGLSVVIAEFVRRSPEFPGDEALARTLGEMSADLETALKSIQ